MKLSKLLWVAVMVISSIQISFATILFVSENPGSAPYSTIVAAYNVSATGDTIVVGPGNYTANLQINNRNLHIIGAGWDVCTWNGYCHTFNSGASGTTIEGFQFVGSGPTHTLYSYTNADSVTFRRCYVTSQSGYHAVYCAAGRVYITDCALVGNNSSCVNVTTAVDGNVVARNCVFSVNNANNSRYSFVGTNNGTIELYNNVFVNFINAFSVTGVPQVIGLNNIFWDWEGSASYGTLPVGSVFEYTAAGGGAPAFPSNFANNINLGSNNPFVSYDDTYYQYPTHNLHLNGGTGGLLCTDSGYPSIQDLDSTAADLGIYGGPKPFVDHGIAAFPFALTLDIDNLVEVGDSVNVVSSGRIGPRY
ncbi:MAG: hypothetical protein KDB65_02005 [Calditrichaeota bacterium]|nr:hypothetical protein [Calditrichota bacterium]